ncbi:hypothetical protein [Halobacillus karajensis]|uniref:hypothetical protein n=1 Tax=Halobacillus karajensis TaxID=195088 RepID=UPI000945924A|nr:hypothetical protein [Halobacillus karajensis]
MLVQVEWINYHKKSELDRPQLFKIIENITVEKEYKREGKLRETTQKEIALKCKLPKEDIQIVQCRIIKEDGCFKE